MSKIQFLPASIVFLLLIVLIKLAYTQDDLKNGKNIGKLFLKTIYGLTMFTDRPQHDLQIKSLLENQIATTKVCNLVCVRGFHCRNGGCVPIPVAKANREKN